MNYKTYRISDICSMVKGNYSTLKTEPGRYPLVVTAEYRRSANTYQLEGPAVCVPLISSTGHGDAALHRVHYQEGKFALANLLVALLPKNESLYNPKYLYYLLMAKRNEYFVPLMSGTANVSLKIQDIAEVEIPLPSFEDQKRIVDRIEELAAKVREVQSLRQDILNELDALISSLIFEKSKDILAFTPLGEVLLPISRPEQIVSSKLYFLLGLRWYALGLYIKDKKKGSEIRAQKIYRVEQGDFVYNRLFAWKGSFALVSKEVHGCYVSNEFPCFQIKQDKVLPKYLLNYISRPSFWDAALGLSSGGTPTSRNRLKEDKLLSMSIPLPTLEKQQQIVEVAAKTESIEELSKQAMIELDAFLPSVLDKAFKGEL